MPIFMKIDGIKGDATLHNHKGADGWFSVESCQLGVHRNIPTGTGNMTSRNAAIAQVSEVVCTKTQSKNSAELFKMACIGEGKKADIHFIQNGAQDNEIYMWLKLEDCMISSYNVSGHGGSGGSRPMESFSLNFTKIEHGVEEHDEKGKSTYKGSMTYSQAQGKHV